MILISPVWRKPRRSCVSICDYSIPFQFVAFSVADLHDKVQVSGTTVRKVYFHFQYSSDILVLDIS